MLTEAQSSRLERRAQSLLQKKSISLAKEIPFSRRRSQLCSPEKYFSHREEIILGGSREKGMKSKGQKVAQYLLYPVL